jgi:hypothetical protein
VPLDEGQADALDPREFGQRPRAQCGDRLKRAVVSDRVRRLAVAGAHAPLAQALQHPGVGGIERRGIRRA